MIISVLNSKGGTGKSTLAVHLARGLQRASRDVWLVDTDSRQGTAETWASIAAEDHGVDIPCMTVQKPKLKNELKALEGLDVVVDGAAKLEKMDSEAIRVSDAILIPVQASGFDLWALSQLADLIETRQKVAGGWPKAAFVVSRENPTASEADEIEEVLADYGFPLIGRIRERKVVARSTAAGTTTWDYTPDHSGERSAKKKATSEFGEVLARLASLLEEHPESSALCGDLAAEYGEPEQVGRAPQREAEAHA